MGHAHRLHRINERAEQHERERGGSPAEGLADDFACAMKPVISEMARAAANSLYGPMIADLERKIAECKSRTPIEGSDNG